MSSQRSLFWPQRGDLVSSRDVSFVCSFVTFTTDFRQSRNTSQEERPVSKQQGNKRDHGTAATDEA
jgi:hypothetical protein